MPISDDALQKEKNRFIAVTSDAKFGQAIAALTSFEGEPWWHLVVRMDDGSWRVAKFSDLRESLANTPNAADLRLGDAAELSAVNAVDRYAVDTKEAQLLARKSPAQVLVVTDGLPVGILVEGVTRSAPPPSPLARSVGLEELGGKYVKLKDYGSILLSGSKK